MKKTIYLNEFVDEFANMNRKDNFSYDGLIKLYNYLEDWYDGDKCEYELDVIGLCCEFTEYNNIDEFHKEFDKEKYPDLDTIEEYTTLITIDENKFIIGEL